MKKPTNHHYVPQYYFKLFTGGEERIHLLLKSHNNIILNSSIRGQCSKKNFYGSAEIEEHFAKIERISATAIAKFLGWTWKSEAEAPSTQDYAALLGSILFQRTRTELEIEKHEDSFSDLMLESFKEYLKQNHKLGDKVAEYVDAIDAGHVRISRNPTRIVLEAIEFALTSRVLISDMRLCFLRNHTDYPFIFSDSPVIFCNPYLKKIKHRGGLGLQSPGLLIFQPIDPFTCLMLFDPSKYDGPFQETWEVNIHERSDVSNLNVLQLLHSHRTVYFSDESDQEYVDALWRSHKQKAHSLKVKSHVRDGWLIDGKVPDGKLFHHFEPQVNHDLNLSFLKYEPMEPEDYEFARRSPELYEQYKIDHDLFN